MPELANSRHETFARARASGMTRRAAFAEARYDERGSNIKRIDSRPEVIERIAELERDLAWGGSPDLKPVINELMRLAHASGKLGSAAGMTAARGLLSEAARLKGLLGTQPWPIANDPTPPPRLSTDEWLAKFAPPR